jgi:hypothetical protein
MTQDETEQEDGETVIYGRSDDLIYVEGENLKKEIYANAREDTFLHLSDGTILEAEFNANWEFKLVREGTREIKIVEAENVDEEEYSHHTQLVEIPGDYYDMGLNQAVKSSSKELEFEDSITVKKVVGKYNQLRKAANRALRNDKPEKAEKWKMSYEEIADFIEDETGYTRAMIEDRDIDSYNKVLRNELQERLAGENEE